MTICSHTLVKNGMPFIDKVLERALPFVDRMIITVSEKSDDGTREALSEFLSRHNGRSIEIYTEDVKYPADLTEERQKQVDMTTEDWIWFLDDDDFYPILTIKSALTWINSGVKLDALALNPYQVLDRKGYDSSWRNKWFTKFFRNKDINYRKPWPRDLIFKGDEMLYWRTNGRVVRIPDKYFHLSGIKDHSFRNEDWATSYTNDIGKYDLIPEVDRIFLRELYDYIR